MNNSKIHTKISPAGYGCNFNCKHSTTPKYEPYTSKLVSQQNWVHIETSETYLNKGISLVELEKYEDAITCYDKAATTDANDSLIWYNRGVALTQLENFDDALSSYEKAIEVSPGYADAWYNKAELLKHKGQDAEAETCFAKVKELEGE